MVKIATWNVNSINARLEHFLELTKLKDSPEIFLLQELKCEEKNFPFQAIEDCGFNISMVGQKSYNGVAIISKYPIEDIVTTLDGDGNDNQARYIEAVITVKDKAIRVVSVYVPNGKSPDHENFNYKLKYFDRLYTHFEELLKYEEILVIGGDFNVAPIKKIDSYDHVNLEGTICCHKEERKRFNSLLGLGLFDAYRFLNPNTQQFTWWDYRSGSWQHNKGLRIDHLLISSEAAKLTISSDVDTQPRTWKRPSDHTPIWCELNI